MIPKGAIEALEKPFYRAKTVNLFGCYFGERMTSFEILFPNVLCLKLDFNEAAKLKIIEEHWRRMRHLEVNIDQRNFKRENIEELLCLNPQLRRLKIGSGWSADFLEDVSIFLQFIEVLEFDRLFEGFTDYSGKPIHFESVKKLKLCLSDTKDKSFPKIPLSFVQLEELTLETNNELDDEFYKFIGRNQNISKLNIISNTENKLIKNHRFEFRNEIAFLTEICLDQYTFSFEQAVELLNNFKFINRFLFTIDRGDQIGDLVNRLNDKWTITERMSLIAENKCVEITRRTIEHDFEYIRQFFEL